MPNTATLSAPDIADSRSAFRARILMSVLARWVRRARTRRELARLDARLLADIGVTREDARLEAAKPFWKA